MIRVSTATADRMRTLGEHCGIDELTQATSRNWKSIVLEFLADTDYTAEIRAGVSFLAVNACYPTRVRFDSIRSLVALNQPSRAFRRILDDRYPARTRRSALVPAGLAVTDITRFAAERFVSGIPRVVRNFLLSHSGQKLNRIVWSNGRPGFVTVNSETGAVTFPNKDWIQANQRARWGSVVVDFLRNLAHRLPWLAFALFSLLRWIPIPAVLLGVRHPQPRTCVLLHNTTIVVAEVMGRDVADRLTTWQRVGLNVSTRFVVHDFLPLTHSRFFSPSSSHEHLLNVEAFAASERIIVGTPLLATEVRAFCDALNRPSPPIDVIPLPVVITPSAGVSSPNPGNPYVVFMGGFDARKRLSEFVDYVLAHRTVADGFMVVIVGNPPVITDKHVYSLVSRIVRNRDVFRLVSGLNDAELSALMSDALAIVYASDAEGYGLPILESLAVGTPVITASNELSRHLKDMYGGILDVFDDSDEAISSIRSLSDTAFLSEIVQTIRKDMLPHNVDDWASKITSGLRTN